MRVINSKTRKFRVGSKVRITRVYQSGNITLNVGDIGKITGQKFYNLPDMGLFNIRVIDINFGKHKISIGVAIAEMHMEGVI